MAWQTEDDNDVGTLKLDTTYRLPGRLWALTIGGGVEWYREMPIELWIGDSVWIDQGLLALFDLMARCQINDQVALDLNVENLTDEPYWVGGNYFGISPGEGRRTLLTLTATF